MKQMRMITKDERDTFEDIKQFCAELDHLNDSINCYKAYLYESLMKLPKDIRFDMIKQYAGETTQKYIIEVFKDHIPELMKEAGE